MKHFICYILYCFLLIIAFACNNSQGTKNKDLQPEKFNSNLETANKLSYISEDDQIEDFIRRNGWDMTKTGTGLRYIIYEKGKGNKVTNNNIVRFHYTIKLLNGVVCENSNSTPKEVRMGRGDIVSGLEEGLLLLSVGDKAKFVIPSYLAYGWVGNSKNIPARAVLIYDVQILQTRNIN